MDKYTYFKLATKAGLYAKRQWVISAFSVVQEAPDAYTKDPYHYRLVHTPAGVLYLDEDLKTLVKIDDATAGSALFYMRETIELNPGDYPNVKTKIRTTFGNCLFNLCSIIYSFGDKIDFVTGKVDVGKLEKQIASRLKDTPKDNEPRDPKYLYVDEYLKFANSFLYLTEFNTLCTIALTPKAITQAPGTIELRNKLISENKDKLDDPLVVAKIESELLKHDSEYLKGDPSEDFLISKKARSIARRKLFLDYGADVGLVNTTKVDFVQKSLSEGWQVEKMPTMINALRAGSFNRGHETQLGGETVKWQYRSSANINTIDTDCGSRLGVAITVNKNNAYKLVGMRVITSNSTALVETKEDAESYLGKRLMVRSPQYCKQPNDDICRYCIGERLGTNPSAAATAVAAVGSTMVTSSLKAFHASGVKTTLAQLDQIMS